MDEGGVGMKKETPRSSKRRAGLADGWKTVAPAAGMPTTGRDPRQKRSPKEQSAVSGTLIQVSQVVLDRLERDHATRWAKATARLRLARSRRCGNGPAIIGGGCSSMPSAQALSNWQICLNNYGLCF